jgi:hypothetical protein
MKMRDRNASLKSALGNMPTVETVREISSIPVEDSVNRQGYAAYSLADELKLISMLNTVRIEAQAYRSENDVMRDLRDLIERIGLKDPYFVAQAIVYSRCKGEGMRSINHLAAALLAPFISGQEYAKRFYGLWNKKEDRGGCIYRPDDMTEIKDVYCALNKGTLSNAMKKGFASSIEALDTYLLAKYKKTVIDIANLVHPDPTKSTATVKDENGNEVNVLNALMNGINVVADTWETAQAEAGQEVAKAVREGKLTKEKAAEVLKEAKAENWNSLLCESKLGILAALRNIRAIMNNSNASDGTVNMLCELVSNPNKLRNGLIMPYQIDTAYEVVRDEIGTGVNQRNILTALLKGYETSIPNLAAALPGKTCVLLDCSGSMHTGCAIKRNGKWDRMRNATACEKAGLVAATIAKATNADIVRFGGRAELTTYDPNTNVFDLGKQLANANMGMTSIAAAFNAIRGRKYDRIILLSDNEANTGRTSTAYKEYLRSVNSSPYVYCIDFASYGTTPLKNDGKINYYYGFGYAMFDDIASKEFNPMQHIDKVRKIVI